MKRTKRMSVPTGAGLWAILGLAFVCTAASAAESPAWPAKPVYVLVGYPAGGSVDLAARVMANALAAKVGQPVVVENRAGADGTIAVTAAIRAPADGYTLVTSLKGAMTVAPATSKLPYEPLTDVVPLTGIAQTAEIYVTRPRTGMTGLRDLPETFKRSGGKLSIGYIGAFPRLLGELLGQEAGVKLLGVPYKGLPPALQDLLGDQIDLVVGDGIGVLLEQVKAGKLVALAVTSESRLAELPTVPTSREAGMPALTGTQWYALFGASSLPPALATRIAAVTGEAVSQPATTAQLVKGGLQPFQAGPSELQALMKRETEFWKAVAVKAGIQPE